MADRIVRMYNPTHRFDTAAQTAPPTDPTVGWSHEFQNPVTEVAVWGDVVYVAVGECVVAIGQDGNSRWRFQTDGGVESSPAVVDDTVYVGSNDNHVYALDANTGTQQWAFETDLFVTSPAVVDGTVYAGSHDGNVYALDANSGTEQWAFETDGDVRSSPAVVDGTVYVGSGGTTVYALDGTGTEVSQGGN
jgi:outer membrane protein assembly factor BamB